MSDPSGLLLPALDLTLRRAREPIFLPTPQSIVFPSHRMWVGDGVMRAGPNSNAENFFCFFIKS